MTKAELSSFMSLGFEVKQLRRQLDALEASIYSPRGQRFTATPRVPSGNRSTMDGAVQTHMDLVALYQSKLAALEERQLAVEQALARVTDPARRYVIRSRYIEGRSWGSIVAEMAGRGYSERQVYRLHGWALQDMAEG